VGLISTSVGGWVGPRAGVWHFEKDKNPFPALYNQTADGPTRRPVTISTTPYKGKIGTWSKNLYSCILYSLVRPFHVHHAEIIGYCSLISVTCKPFCFLQVLYWSRQVSEPTAANIHTNVRSIDLRADVSAGFGKQKPIIFNEIPNRHTIQFAHFQLTPWSRTPQHKPPPSIVKNFPAFYGTRNVITTFTVSPYVSLSWVTSVHSTLKDLFKI
jgi:hypothetical protein